jgi:hypothetical protein
VSFSLRTALALTAASAFSLTVFGCGGGGGGDPLASMSAKQVLTKAVSDLKSASTFRVSGRVNQDGGLSLQLTYKHGTGCEGTLGLGSRGSLYLLVIGDVAWMKPDDTFWKTYAGSSASQVIALMGGRYLKGSTSSSQVSGLTQICDANYLASSLASPKDIAKGPVTTVNGQQALELKDKSKSATMYVTDTSSPQILQVISTQSGNSGKVYFTGYGNPVTLTPPPASETINGAPFGF